MFEQFLKLMSFSKTKLLGYLIFITGTLYGFGQHDTNVMQTSWYLSALLVGGKTITDSITKIKSGGAPNAQ